MKRPIAKFCAAALAGAILVTALAPSAAVAFETRWFTQRSKNLRAGAGADDDNTGRPGQRPAPAADPCGQGRKQANRANGGQDRPLACQ